MSGESNFDTGTLENIIEKEISTWTQYRVCEKYPFVQRKDFKDLERGLALLKISKEEFGVPWVTAEEINSLIVEVFNLPSDPLAIKRAFARAGGSNKTHKPVISKKINNVIFYKLSHPGEELLNSIIGKGLLQILYLRPHSHFDAYETISELVKKLKGKELKISDPYYGINTLNVLEEIVRTGKNVKFLSNQTSENPLKFNKELNYLRKHYPKKIECKIYPKKELHDRYILAEDSFVVIGQGIKDLGNKESLVLVLDDRFGKDTRKELEKAFWGRWQDNTCAIL
jgi:hypothetical protein